MASDSTSIADLPGGNNAEQQNRVVLEKSEIPSALNCQLSYKKVERVRVFRHRALCGRKGPRKVPEHK